MTMLCFVSFNSPEAGKRSTAEAHLPDQVAQALIPSVLLLHQFLEFNLFYTFS